MVFAQPDLSSNLGSPADYLWDLEEPQRIFKSQFVQLKNEGTIPDWQDYCENWLKLGKWEVAPWACSVAGVWGFSLPVISGSIPGQALGLAAWLVKLPVILTSSPFSLLGRVALEWACGWYLDLYVYKYINDKNLFGRFGLKPSFFPFLSLLAALISSVILALGRIVGER